MADSGSVSDSELPRPTLNNGRYQLPWPYKKIGFASMMKFLITESDYSNIPSAEVMDKELPVQDLNIDEVRQPPADNRIRVTWLGHASVLVQMNGISVLTDPVFSDRCGPIVFPRLQFGPRRYRRCPCTVQSLPDIDAVVISHSHYDHLDYSTVRELSKRFGDQLTWFVPSGLKSWMVSSGCQKVVELGWWQEQSVNMHGQEIKFFCVPAVHWGYRSLTDRNKTLCGGWGFSGPHGKFYFAGDTKYNDEVFKLIGRKYGPFDLAAIPIGAYEPRHIMENYHINPEEAFKIHEDVRAYNTLAIHWGTFKLTYEFYLEPRQKIEAIQKEKPLEEGRLGFFTVTPGCTRLLDGRPRSVEGGKDAA